MKFLCVEGRRRGLNFAPLILYSFLGIVLVFNLHRIIGAKKSLFASVLVRRGARQPVRDAIRVRADEIHQPTVARLVVVPVETVSAGHFVGVDRHAVGRSTAERRH